jgi:hypothetical protein
LGDARRPPIAEDEGRRIGGSDCGTSGARRDCGNRRESEERVSSALNQNSNGIAAAGMTGPVYVTEPPLSPPSPRASAQAPVPTPPSSPERPVLEVAPAPAPAPAPVSEALPGPPPAPAVPASAEPEAPAGLPLEGLLLRFGLITTEQLTEAMRERSATGKDIGAIVVERGWVDAAQLARVVSGDTSPAPEPAPEPELAADPEPEPTPAPPPPAAAQSVGQRVKVFIRLTSGERVDAGSFGSLDQAKERGAEIARTLAADSPEWPFVAGRFLRPDTIVSLDVEPELSV